MTASRAVAQLRRFREIFVTGRVLKIFAAESAPNSHSGNLFDSVGQLCWPRNQPN
jgi:hypothetical protein